MGKGYTGTEGLLTTRGENKGAGAHVTFIERVRGPLEAHGRERKESLLSGLVERAQRGTGKRTL